MTGIRTRWTRACAITLLAVGAIAVDPADAAPPSVSCGQTITRSTTLQKDVGPCPGDGIIIGADNITLNLNGYKIRGQDLKTGNFAGVRLPNRTGVTVVGGRLNVAGNPTATISGFDAGVFINRGSANTVKNLLVKDNIGPADRNALLGDGIAIFNSANNTIQRNTIDHNGVYDGIGVLGNDAHGNILQANTVTRTVALIDPEDGPAGNGTGVGILVDAFLEEATGKLIRGNQVLNNVIRANDGSGSSNVNTADGRVAGNTIEDNGHVQIPGNGIGLQLGLRPESYLGHMVIEDNVIRRNGSNGIYSIDTTENQYLRNTIEDNGWEPPRGWQPWGGIFVRGTPVGGNVIAGNAVRHNYEFGIVLSATEGGGGVASVSDNNRIEGNRVTEHPADGIFVDLAGGTNYIVSNYAVNNAVHNPSWFADLTDGGGLFGLYDGCGDNVWSNNTYEIALPECAGADGHQVSVPTPGASDRPGNGLGGRGKPEPGASPPVRRGPAGSR